MGQKIFFSSLSLFQVAKWYFSLLLTFFVAAVNQADLR